MKLSNLLKINMGVKMRPTKKLFYICDDNHETLFVDKIWRSDDQLINKVKKLKVGDIYPLSKTTYLLRGK